MPCVHWKYFHSFCPYWLWSDASEHDSTEKDGRQSTCSPIWQFYKCSMNSTNYSDRMTRAESTYCEPYKNCHIILTHAVISAGLDFCVMYPVWMNVAEMLDTLNAEQKHTHTSPVVALKTWWWRSVSVHPTGSLVEYTVNYIKHH